MAKPDRWFLSGGLLAAAAYLAWRTAGIMRVPAGVRIGWITDDAYYYLSLARRFAETGQWSFDGGQSVTTGFHLLWGYWLAAIHAVFGPSDEAFVLIAVGSSSLFAVSCLLFCAIMTFRGRDAGGATILVAMAFSPHFVANAFGCMEWSMTVLVSAILLVSARASFGRAVPSRAVTIAVNAAAFFLVLARSDAVLLVGVLVAVALPRFRLGSLRRAGGIGGLAGVAIVILHNWWLTGVLASDSARIKMLWTESLTGWHPGSTARLAAALFSGDVLPAYGGVVLAGLGVVFVALSLTGSRRAAPDRTTRSTVAAGSGRVAIGCGIYIVLWASLYAINLVGLFMWYSSLIVLPLAVAGGWGLNRIAGARGARYCSVVAAIVVVGFGVTGWRQAPYYHWNSVENLIAARALRNQSNIERVGSWNAGSLGFYSRDRVVNLDGLVNHDIYAYLRENRLPEYLRERNIRWILDRSYCVTERFRRVIMGYDRPAFLDALHVAYDFSSEREEGGAHLLLWDVQWSPRAGTGERR